MECIDMSFQEQLVAKYLQGLAAESHEICHTNPLLGLVATHLNRRDIIDDKGHKLIDFSHQCYMGFDFEEPVIEAHKMSFGQDGNIVPWCRVVGTMDVFKRAEDQLANLMNSEAANLFLSTTLLNHGAIAALGGRENGHIFIEDLAHDTMVEGAMIAQSEGAQISRYSNKDLDALEQALKDSQADFKIVLCDGVGSMSGDYAPLADLDKIARKYDALIYVDDAHGFGVIGENPSEEHPYGHKGNGIVNHYGLKYDHIFYVGCLSKAYGILGSFVACSKAMKDFLLSSATPHDLGNAGPAAAVNGLLAAIEINKNDGDRRRTLLHKNTMDIYKGLQNMGFQFNEKNTHFPIVSVSLPLETDLQKVSEVLYKNNIFLTVQPYYDNGQIERHLLRITVGHDLNSEHIEKLMDAFKNLKAYLDNVSS
jgi:8-amino-7-oxononanoate synthase